jgi:putative flippase GtrA
MKSPIKKMAKNSVSGETILFIRIQIASILGSAADYLLTIMLASGLGFYYLLANLAGNILGGAVQFYLSRKWAFPSAGGSVNGQIFRFALVFSGGLVLSAVGVFLLTNYGGLHYVLSKTIVSIFLGVTYNYLLQKKFVFASDD